MQKSIYTTQQRHFLTLLRLIRKEAGLTQQQMAARLDTLQSRITDYERGVRRMDLMELKQVCLAAGVTLPEFVQRFEAMVAEDHEVTEFNEPIEVEGETS